MGGDDERSAKAYERRREQPEQSLEFIGSYTGEPSNEERGEEALRKPEPDNGVGRKR